MNKAGSLISQLFAIRNKYGVKFSARKLNLMRAIGKEKLTVKRDLQCWYDTLLFLLAYPDNPALHRLAFHCLQQLELQIQSHEKIQDKLFNTGITHTNLCAAFSFEIVKWLRRKHPKDVWLSSFEADDAQMQSVLSVVMPKVESEILQDGNSDWKAWLKGSMRKGEDLLDRLIAVFDECDIRPEVKDELWAAIGINVEINLSSHLRLPASLTRPYYHHSLIKKALFDKKSDFNFRKIELTDSEAEQIIECGKMILVRHLREIDPISFTAASFVNYYQLSRGVSIALTGMIPERRHPVDSYMGYLVFKNGLPVAYAASWILFDSARIGLNVFPSYRGGESQYFFGEALKLHKKVYHLNRFSVDPYQIGKENSDAIRSGAFWVYYHAGFRPLQKKQNELAQSESLKIQSIPGYRSSASVLTQLADSRMEIILQKTAAEFDATDLSRAYANIIKKRFDNNRKLAEESCFKKLVRLLQIKTYHRVNMQFVLKNWSVLLLTKEQELARDRELKKILRQLFESKAHGWEEDFISGLQRSKKLKNLVAEIVDENLGQ